MEPANPKRRTDGREVAGGARDVEGGGGYLDEVECLPAKVGEHTDSIVDENVMFEDAVQASLLRDEKPESKIYFIREIKGGEYPVAYETHEDAPHT